MADEISIYALLDESRQIRYVGQSKNPEWRALKHWRERRSMQTTARKGVPLSSETRDRMRVAAKKQAAIMRWCGYCDRDWSIRVWTRHVRKYHDGGVW